MKLKVFILMFFYLISFSSIANTYFVSKDGDNGDSGSEEHPWKTIQMAANTLIAGDTVFIKGGVYTEIITIKNSGAKDNYITFINYKNETVVIDGQGLSWGANWYGLFNIIEKNYILVSGLNIKNSEYAAIWIEGSNNISVKNNYTYNTFSSGIGIWNSSYVFAENNEVELACNEGEQECITISNSNNCQVFKNNVHHNGKGENGGEGIDVKQGSHDVDIYDNEVHHLNERIGIYADAWDTLTYNINIYNNKVHHCSESGIAVASEAGGVIGNVNIFNNVVYLNKYGGIEIGDWSDIDFQGKKPIKHIKIINNTCYKNGAYNDGWGFGIIVDNPDASDIVIRNNICSDNSAQIAIQKFGSVSQVDHNLIDGFNDSEFAVFGKDSIIGAPLFVDAEKFDFHLKRESPAIDSGSSIDVPEFDIEYKSRPINGIFDIGAYEFHWPLSVDNYTDFSFKLSPNPANNFIELSFSKINKFRYTIFDLQGNELMKGTSQKRIEIYKLKTGLYFIKLENNKSIGRFIKK